MLRLVIAGAGLLFLGSLANSRESSSRKKYQKKLEDKKDYYDYKVERRRSQNEYKKRTQAFRLLKEEQTQLKAQRVKLFELRNLQTKGSSLYKQITKNIAEISKEIEEKQAQADLVRY